MLLVDEAQVHDRNFSLKINRIFSLSFFFFCQFLVAAMTPDSGLESNSELDSG